MTFNEKKRTTIYKITTERSKQQKVSEQVSEEEREIDRQIGRQQEAGVSDG